VILEWQHRNVTVTLVPQVMLYSTQNGLNLSTQTTIKDPLERRGADQNYWVWEPADYTRDYMVVADVARGDGKDSSAFHIS
jgi:hypothetical protein